MKQYDLVEVAKSETTAEQNNSIEYAEKAEIQALRGEIERINSIIEKLSEVNDNE
jgi:hypothetical protein